MNLAPQTADDDDLALRAALIDVTERVDDLDESEAPIDDGLELAGRAQLLQGRR